MKHHEKKIVSLVLALALVLPLCPLTHAKAETLTDEDINNHQIVKNRYPTVVSLGDSYSSGEGGEDYYGMSDSLENRIEDQDWLGHRSADSWPGKLTFVNEQGKRVALKEYRYNQYYNEPRPTYNEAKWFFTAVSGAVTADFDGQQRKDYNLTKEYEEREIQRQYQDLVDFNTIAFELPNGSKYLNPQKVIFDDAGTEDYVTITIGGNDVGFADIVMQCLYSNTDSPGTTRRNLKKYTGIIRLLQPIVRLDQQEIITQAIITADNLLTYDGLDRMLADVMRDIDKYEKKIKDVYVEIQKKAPDAAIIVAGYPKLLYSKGGVVNWQADTLPGNLNDTVTQTVFSEYEAETINKNVELFNDYLAKWVAEVRTSKNCPIYFVDVASKFGDRGAYAPDECINGAMLLARPGELDQAALVSAGSFHPNAKGREVYANAVQEYIETEVELKQIKGKVRVVNSDMSVSAAKEGYTIELTRVSDFIYNPLTVKTASDGTFATTNKEVGIGKGIKAGDYSLRVFDPNNRECDLLGNGGSTTVKLMYHTSGDLDILVSPKQEVSGTVNIRTVKNKAVEADFSDDPLILCFTDKTGRKTVCPADDQAPITRVGSKGVKYSVLLFPGEYTIEALGKNSGVQYSFSVGGDAGNESVSMPNGKDVKGKNLTLLGNSQTYVGTWVDEITYSSGWGVSSTTKMTLELGKMMDASLTMEASTDISTYGWSESGLPASNYQAEAYQGTWRELDNGIVLYLNGDPNAPVYFDLVKRNTLELNLNKLAALASSSSEEGLMMMTALETLKLAMSMDVGSLFGMSFGTSMNDMLGIDSIDELLYFYKQ